MKSCEITSLDQFHEEIGELNTLMPHPEDSFSSILANMERAEKISDRLENHHLAINGSAFADQFQKDLKRSRALQRAFQCLESELEFEFTLPDGHSTIGDSEKAKSDHLSKILDLDMEDLRRLISERLASSGFSLDLSQGAVAWLLREGFRMERDREPGESSLK